jgi:NAD(P)-dependent dehydrogenase (short-subunit alcohol dehydrogenase family)
MATIPQAADIAEAVLFLTQARQVTGQTLYVNGGGHLGRW